MLMAIIFSFICSFISFLEFHRRGEQFNSIAEYNNQFERRNNYFNIDVKKSKQ